MSEDRRRKTKNMIQIKKIASNSLFQSLVFGAILTTIFIMVWDAPIKKYIIKIDPFEHKSDYGVHWFVDDFNGDGNSERIRCFNGINSKSMDMVYYEKNGNITEHYHLGTSEWNYQLKPVVFDIDGDKTKELLFFTIRNDSIFFNVYSLANFEFIIEDLYFNTFFRKRDNYAYISHLMHLEILTRMEKTSCFLSLMLGLDCIRGEYSKWNFHL